MDVSLKVWDFELAWFDFSDDPRQIVPEELMSQFLEIIETATNTAKDLQLEVNRHLSLMDNEMVYPTGIGFPLKLKFSGNGELNLKTQAQFDLPAILRDPKNAKIKMELIPRADFEITGSLSTDAYIMENGLKFVTLAHTAGGGNVNFRILDGTGIEFTLGLPTRKQELINAETNIFKTFKHRNLPEELTPVQFDIKQQNFDLTMRNFEPMTGLALYSSVAFPFEGRKILLPVFGPSKFVLGLEKMDDNLNHYSIRAYYDKKTPNQRTFNLVIDTPGSSRNRKIGLMIKSASEPKRELEAALDTPWTQILGRGFPEDPRITVN